LFFQERRDREDGLRSRRVRRHQWSARIDLADRHATGINQNAKSLTSTQRR
jgi:hypothetical protein